MPTGKCDLISRKALLDDRDILTVYTREYGNIDVIPVEIVVDAPAVEAEPLRHGRWVDRMVRDWRCSECGEAIYKVRNVDGYCYDDKPNYCPKCGAKMDG